MRELIERCEFCGAIEWRTFWWRVWWEVSGRGRRSRKRQLRETREAQARRRLKRAQEINDARLAEFADRLGEERRRQRRNPTETWVNHRA